MDNSLIPIDFQIQSAKLPPGFSIIIKTDVFYKSKQLLWQINVPSCHPAVTAYLEFFSCEKKFGSKAFNWLTTND